MAFHKDSLSSSPNKKQLRKTIITKLRVDRSNKQCLSNNLATKYHHILRTQNQLHPIMKIAHNKRTPNNCHRVSN